jgi:hypothetical protein
MSQMYGNPPGGGVDYAAISKKVSLPAIFMMVIAGLTILWDVLSVVLNLAGVSMSGLAPGGGEQSGSSDVSGGSGSRSR